ncbi:hypothetical protein TrST_g1348 [Triparma strigata]|uniref:Uncharacterized protein n=1 Tax=Triparma strigata TaxID=1606541 RepID=A0A9W7BRF9_9STRA|nr:hypothetical protein TrST_g1348 [Triparma strigata]
MSMLEDEVAGKRQAFMAENRMYYLTTSEDKMGLWHPFFHDLRSRGTAIAKYDPSDGTPKAGVGNDYTGWEWYRATNVAVGSIVDHAGPTLQVTGEKMIWDQPVPTRMWWRPDRIINEYDLESPYVPQGTYPGGLPWNAGTQWESGVDFWGWFVFDTPEDCFAQCDASTICFSAVYEVDADGNTQCWIGPTMYTEPPDPTSSRGEGKVSTTYVKGIEGIEPVLVREEKFITQTEVVSVTFTSSRPVTLRFDGGSYTTGLVNKPDRGVVGGLQSLNGTCSHDSATDTLRVDERGRSLAKVFQDPVIEREGRFVLDKTSAVLAASLPLRDVEISSREGWWGPVCEYRFTLPLDGTDNSVALSWSMDDKSKYYQVRDKVVAGAGRAEADKQAKTDRLNLLLSDVVPYFRCSDHDVVKIYYYLWSVYLMLYIDVGDGLESYPHTQSAANNFLGMHRFDAVFQIRVGAWTNPDHHDFYANGNVLIWENVFNRGLNSSNMLPDNFGIDWGSAIFGNEVNLHIIGALEIFEHSGDREFLQQAYNFYKSLYWSDMFWVGNCFQMAYDAILALNTMAKELGVEEEGKHWNSTGGMDFWTSEYYQTRYQAKWDSSKNWNVTGNAAFNWIEIAGLGIGDVKREWVENMGRIWLANATHGHFDIVPLSRVPLKNYHKDDDEEGNPRCPLGTASSSPQCTGGVDKDFTIVPDGSYWMLWPLYRHKVSDVANKITLAHLKRYNMENGLPVAPEARRLDLKEFGNQFNNFNAGKILLYLQGIGGLRVSNIDDSFTFADSLPTNWTYMEFRVPVKRNNSEGISEDIQWIKARAEREREGNVVKKKITVENSPFTNLFVQPWADGAEVMVGNGGIERDNGHVEWEFHGEAAGGVEVELKLDYFGREDWDGGEDWDGSLEAEGLTSKYRDYYACQPNCIGAP